MRRIDLPTLDAPTPGSLDEAILNRRSIRSFVDRPLTPGQLGRLLWSAQGVTLQEMGLRAVPSAGATFPLELYVVAQDGLSRYICADHALEVLDERDLRGALARASLNQSFVARASCSIVIAAEVSRTEGRYHDRAARYVLLEAGHAAQNICLEAVALGLGAVCIGAFNDQEVAKIVGLAEGRPPLYYITVGCVPGGAGNA